MRIMQRTGGLFWKVKSTSTNFGLTQIKKRIAASIGVNRDRVYAKAFTIDDRYCFFVGWFNWDPRSVNINTEMGILIDSPEFTRKTSDALRGVLREETFAVRLRQGQADLVDGN